MSPQPPLAPRPEITAMPPAIHGARNYAELATLGLSGDDVLDFSSNTNPYGAPPAVLDAVRRTMHATALKRYPDRDALALRTAISRHIHIAPEKILPGNGTAELIQTIALTYVRPGSGHAILSPTFGEYARAVQLLGGRVEKIVAPPPDFRFNPETVAQQLQNLQPDTVWLCNPNNPTGQQWPADALTLVRRSAPQALWVVDEAYRHFTAAPTPAIAASNTIILRSLTKDFALAGLRMGYAIAHPAVIAAMKAAQPPWSVNSPAQIAGTAAFLPESVAWRQRTLTKLRRNAVQLWDNLRALGMTVLPTDTTFALIAVNDAPETRHRLLEQRILVRDATSFGLPQHIRVAARRPAENRQLVAALSTLNRKL